MKYQFREKIPRRWCLAFGNIDSIEKTIWHDDRLAIFGSDPSVPWVFSPSERFVVVGDAWIGDRQLLERFPDENPALPFRDLRWVASAWERWGEETFRELVGIFAFAVWDRERRVLQCGRDRVGGRTLYYTIEGTTRWIAPDSRSLLPHHSKEIDLIALRDYLCCAFVPGKRTLWREVRELEPGTTLFLPEERIRAYWQLPLDSPEEASKNSLEWHGKELRSLLERVVIDCLPAGQPVGVFLSGGLDSSAVTAIACKFHDAPVHTYSIHFGKDQPNELEFSGLVAEHCGTEHHILEITFRDMWQRLPETMARLDDPIGDPLTVPNLLLGNLAKEAVGVILNGEGGDPCFGGPKNQPMLLDRLYGDVTGQDPVYSYLLSFQKCASDLPRLLKPEIWETVRGESSVFAEYLHANAGYLNRLMALNIKFKGADHILTKVNNLTGAVGLEGRSPLFDPRIVELSAGIPPEYKLSGAREKAVLKEAIADLLPEAIIDRPKSGMMVPVQRGFKDHWQREAKSLLLNRKAAIGPYLERSIVRDWLHYEGDTWQRYGVKLWLLVSLEIWLQVNRK